MKIDRGGVAVIAACMVMVGCGGSTASRPAAQAVTPLPLAGSGDLVAEVVEAEAAPAPDPLAVADLTGLPAAPWSTAPLPSDAVPTPLLSAWASAANRAQCAPIAPARLGAAQGAQARVSPELVEGGWAVEFDRRGLPGMTARGDTCRRCGRGVFGIAGTRMTPDALVGEEDALDVPTPTFADGSHLAVEPPAEGEDVAAATLTVRGQGCVYQVWSFLGEAHLRELVDGLRLVDVERADPVIAAR